MLHHLAGSAWSNSGLTGGSRLARVSHPADATVGAVGFGAGLPTPPPTRTDPHVGHAPA